MKAKRKLHMKVKNYLQCNINKAKALTVDMTCVSQSDIRWTMKWSTIHRMLHYGNKPCFRSKKLCRWVVHCSTVRFRFVIINIEPCWHHHSSRRTGL